MKALYLLIDTVLNIYTWLIIAYVILSWLVAFNVINNTNQFVYAIGNFLHKITEPVMRPIRKILPSFGGIDLSPIVVLLVIFFIRQLLFDNWGRSLMVAG